MLECIIAISLLLIISITFLRLLTITNNFYQRAFVQTEKQADLGIALELILREAREGQIVYGEKLPNAPASLVIAEEIAGRKRQIRYRLNSDASGSYSLLREVCYPGTSNGYQGHNPVARKIKTFQIKVTERYLAISLEDSHENTVSGGTALRNHL